MQHGINTTRGVPFEPMKAKRLRDIEAQIRVLRFEQHGAKRGSRVHEEVTDDLLIAQRQRRNLLRAA